MSIDDPKQGKPKAKDCPLCGLTIPGGPEAMNRHFEKDCPWRHTSKSPVGDPAEERRTRGGTGAPSRK
jgi:hypothetical protein